MEDNESSSDYEIKSLRNVARVISTVLAGIILLLVVGYWIEDISVRRFAERWTLESTGMAVYSLLILAGSGFGWRLGVINIWLPLPPERYTLSSILEKYTGSKKTLKI